MARAAVVLHGTVINVIEIDENYELPDGSDGAGEVIRLAEDDFVGPGFTRDGEQWSPPEAPEVPDPEPTPLEALRADLDWVINYVVTGEA